MKLYLSLTGLVLLALLMAACTPFIPITGELTPPVTIPQETRTSTSTATATESATFTLIPAGTLTETSTPTLTRINPATLAPTSTPTLTPTSTPTLTSTSAPTLTPTSTPTLTPTSTPTSTPTMIPTAVVIPCNRVEFVADVTIPDGTLVDAGVTFTKTWRLRNIGTCTWSPDYRVVFVSGNQLGGPDYILLDSAVVPGQTIDISLVLTAPSTSGTYVSTYKLADASGSTFGSATGNGSFFVTIQQDSNPNSPNSQVSLSTNRVQAGQELIVTVRGFPANSDIDYRVGKLGEDFSLVYDGRIGENGTASKTIAIPTTAVAGEYWVVQVSTSSQVDGISVFSHSIYITAGYIPPNGGDAQVSLSTTQAHAGQVVTVSVSGFPANSEIDYRVGKLGETYSLVYDGTTGPNGTASRDIILPGEAAAGDYWVVQVSTTSLPDVIKFSSHSILIISGNTPPYSGDLQISLSTLQARPGEQVVVFVSGFPANTVIDLRVGQQGKIYSVVYDGTIGVNGTATNIVAIPTSAQAGQYWIVQVTSTNLQNVITITSRSIYIIN